MKIKALLLSLAVVATLFVGCGAKEPAKTTPTSTEKTDVVTTASLVNTEADFENGISKDGKWIISTLKDLTFTKDIVVEGDFKNTKDPAVAQRKVALYTQTEERVVVDRFTLTAPKLTFKSPAGSIEHGTFKGDLFIEASNFQLKDCIVEGNIYFTTDEAQSTFKMDDKSSVSGVKELKK